MRPTILSIQSWVATGHVGNAAAMFPLQRLGAEVWAVHTVQFSNHPGHGGFTGQVFPGEATRALVQGIAARGLLRRCDAVLSGYMGDAATGAAVLDAVRLVRAANPPALYCCDPVIGDFGRGVFVRPGIPELLAAEAVPAADVLTPNQFELEHLTGMRCGTLGAVREACGRLLGRMAAGGRRTVLVTSLDVAETPADGLDMLAVGPEGAFLLRTPRLPMAPNGAGDAVAALFLLHLLRSGSARRALEAAGSSVAGLLRRTLEAQGKAGEEAGGELLLVEAQEEFVRPGTAYVAMAL